MAAGSPALRGAAALLPEAPGYASWRHVDPSVLLFVAFRRARRVCHVRALGSTRLSSGRRAAGCRGAARRAQPGLGAAAEWTAPRLGRQREGGSSPRRLPVAGLRPWAPNPQPRAERTRPLVQTKEARPSPHTAESPAWADSPARAREGARYLQRLEGGPRGALRAAWVSQGARGAGPMAPEKHALSPSLLRASDEALGSVERAGRGHSAQGHPRGFFLPSCRTAAVPGAPRPGLCSLPVA